MLEYKQEDKKGEFLNHPAIKKFCESNSDYFISEDKFELIYKEVLLALKKSDERSDDALRKILLENPELKDFSLLDTAKYIDSLPPAFYLYSILRFKGKQELEDLLSKTDRSSIQTACNQLSMTANGLGLWRALIYNSKVNLDETSDDYLGGFLDLLLPYVSKESREQTFQAHENSARQIKTFFLDLVLYKGPNFLFTFLLKVGNRLSLDAIVEVLSIMSQPGTISPPGMADILAEDTVFLATATVFLEKGLDEDWWSGKDLVTILKKQASQGVCNTLLHIIARRSNTLASRFLLLILNSVSSQDKELITQIAFLRDEIECHTLFFYVATYQQAYQSKNFVEDFLKKLDIEKFIDNIPALIEEKRERNMWPFFHISKTITIKDRNKGTWKETYRQKLIKDIIDSSDASITVCDLNNSKNASNSTDLRPTKKEHHPSWISFYIETYQAAYKKIQEQKTLNKEKSKLVLLRMFHLSFWHFHVNNHSNPEAKELLFSTLTLILTRPAHEIAAEMQAQNNQSDIAQLIESLTLYIPTLLDEIEKTEAELKMIAYVEELPCYPKIPSEYKEKYLEEAQSLMEEEKEEKREIIAKTDQEEAALVAIHKFYNSVQYSDITLEKTSLSLDFLTDKKRKLEAQLSYLHYLQACTDYPKACKSYEKAYEEYLRTLNPYQDTLQKIRFYLLVPEINPSYFLHWFYRIWHYFFPPPPSETDYFKNVEKLESKKQKVNFITDFLSDPIKINRVSTEFKEFFEELSINLKASIEAQEKNKRIFRSICRSTKKIKAYEAQQKREDKPSFSRPVTPSVYSSSSRPVTPFVYSSSSLHSCRPGNFSREEHESLIRLR